VTPPGAPADEHAGLLADAHPSTAGGEAAVDCLRNTTTVLLASVLHRRGRRQECQHVIGVRAVETVVVVTPLDVCEAVAQHRLAQLDPERVHGVENLGSAEHFRADLGQFSQVGRAHGAGDQHALRPHHPCQLATARRGSGT
jgi:hypothetical protein